MGSHDPFEAVELLRNHLAAHDRPISFLLGAGTSASITVPSATPGAPEEPLIPAAARLTQVCKVAVCKIDPKFAGAWDALELECTEEDTGVQADIEKLLSRVRTKRLAAGSTETPLGLNRAELTKFESEICRQIAMAVTPEEAKIPSTLPHDDFAGWLRKVSRRFAVEIFTTNYDLIMERSLERARVPIFDGFVGTHRPFFLPESLEDSAVAPPRSWVRVWKLHGSINWSLETGNKKKTFIRQTPEKAGDYLVLPSSFKYDEARKQPYQAMIERFGRVLHQRESLLVTCGYSFRDEHIDSIIFDSLDRSPLTHVVALKHGPLDENHQLAVLAKEHPNLLVLAKNAACIGRRYGEWKLSKPVDDKTSSFMDIAFDSTPSTGGVPTAMLALGDFKRFARLLAGMESSGNKS
jgi:hypothetical protein